MNYLSVDTYSTNNFTHNFQTRMLISEASQLQLNGFKRLYADAYDRGLALFNPRTNRTSYWYLADTCVSDDQVQYWDLMACDPENEIQSQYVMRIFND